MYRMFPASFEALAARLTVISTNRTGCQHAMMSNFHPGKPTKLLIIGRIYIANFQNTVGTGFNAFAASLAMS
jgi:hypothetical protein